MVTESRSIRRSAWLAALPIALAGALGAQLGVKSEQKISAANGGFGTLAQDDRFGTSIASLGDLDLDGVADLAVGAPGDDTGGDRKGAVWIVFLNADGTVKARQKLAEGAGFGGTLQPIASFGRAVACPGDVDGDGIPDLAVSTQPSSI